MAGSILSLPRDDQPEGFRTALELARADPEQPRDILQAIAPEAELKLEAANEEIARLNEELARRDEKIKSMAVRQPIYTPKKFFDMLERISMNTLAPIIDHEAVDSGERDIARELRVRPDELRHYLNKGTITPLEAIAELHPLLDAANKLLEQRKRGSAETKNDHRARLLLEKLQQRGEIRTAQAMDIIDGDEGVEPNRAMTRRAMRQAAEIAPHKAEFVPSVPGDVTGSILRRR